MVQCEDFPCCGHESGCCPRFDKSGNQLDMVCTCGKRLPVTNVYSICNSCLKAEDEEDEDDHDDDWEFDQDNGYDEDDDWDEDDE